MDLSGAGAGTWTWHWEGVGANNNIKVNGPFGSPTTYGGQLSIDDAAGPVILYVRSNLFVRGPITRTAGAARPASAFLLGYFGTNTAFMEVPYRGSMIAPLAGIALGPQNAGSGLFEGQWFAKGVELRPNVQVRFAD